MKSFPLSGTDVLLQSDLVLSSKFVLNLELGFDEFDELKFEGVYDPGRIRANSSSPAPPLEYPSTLRIDESFGVLLIPNSFCVNDLP